MWLMATFAACPFATYPGFSCSLWHQDTAAAAAVCGVNLGNQGGKDLPSHCSQQRMISQSPPQIPCEAGAAWKPERHCFKRCN